MSDSDRSATSAADLFDLLWESLADVLGTAAAALLPGIPQPAPAAPRRPSGKKRRPR